MCPYELNRLYRDWEEWNTTLYPSGGAFANRSLGGIPLAGSRSRETPEREGTSASNTSLSIDVSGPATNSARFLARLGEKTAARNGANARC